MQALHACARAMSRRTAPQASRFERLSTNECLPCFYASCTLYSLLISFPILKIKKIIEAHSAVFAELTTSRPARSSHLCCPSP